jgi:heat shock protein HslJ
LTFRNPTPASAIIAGMKQLLLLPALTLTGCLTAPPPPPPPYHAVGTEPFWNLLIDEHNLTFTVPEAAPVAQPTPKAIIGIAGEIYQTPRINVNIVHGQCSDGMSDRSYPDKVQVTVDGRRFEGCGGL